MIEVRFHGRGGQGVVLASEILANAAFLEGKQVQSFPFFGVERRGAPLVAFSRISDETIRVKSIVRTPDYVVVLDSSLLRTVDVAAGLKEGGLLIVNGPQEMKVNPTPGRRAVVFDATAVSLRHGLGTRTAPIVNTAMLGAFAAATGLLRIESLERSIPGLVPGRPEANVAACREAYEMMLQEAEVYEG